MKKCPECGSENIIENARAVDLAENMADYGFKVAIDADPDAFLFKGSVYSDIRADVCADCGLIRFYAVNARNLWQTYQNR